MVINLVKGFFGLKQEKHWICTNEEEFIVSS